MTHELQTPVLSVRGLTTVFERHRERSVAVDDVSFDVPAGSSVGIIGESGCGKSTTVRSVLGLLDQNGRTVAGSARFQGTDLLKLRPRQYREIRGRRIGFVSQNPFGALNPVLRIEKQFHNVISAHRKTTKKASYERAVELLEAVGLSDPERVARGYAHQLSGGMAQRVVIAIALCLDPDLVVADEPTTALDATVQVQILDLLAKVVTGAGRSLLIVTHDLGVVAQYCASVVVMHHGRVVETGPVDRVLVTPDSPHAANLLAAVKSTALQVEGSALGGEGREPEGGGE
ncbi:ABC transporter ATP-binding protein [Phytohabitans kaempferiae]|uniref:ABC transporter ATP-binding protein n=1 Tax=Phytohabitans kaempferiae TaxID=1620943 RepID=A0ABV6M313_9ACTN